MLTREESREQLQSFVVQDWKERRLAAASDLGAPLAHIGQALLDFEASYGYGSPDQRRRAEERQTALQSVDTLTPAQRSQLTRSFSTYLARTVSRT